MGAFIDMSGKTCGKLVVLCRSSEVKNGAVAWECRCFCGKITSVSGRFLRNGMSTTCGCTRIKNATKANTRHGLRYTAEYAVWLAMKQRVTNPKDKRYKDYGGRGIKISNDWLEFTNFYRDMGQRPSSEYSIDRIDNDGNYEHGNCRWATIKEQANNRRPRSGTIQKRIAKTII